VTDIPAPSPATLPEEPSDETLAARAAAFRDPEIFGVLVARHQARVRGYLLQLAGNPAAADDMAQDAFIRAWDRLETYAGKGRFVSWIMAIAHKQFLQAVRKGRRVRRLAAEIEHQAATDDVTHGATAEDGADLVDANRLLSVLSEDERTVMLLAYGYGLSHGDIVAVTDLALGTVKSHIHRGKEKLRNRFGLESEDHA
jgi:RNA polymerase sigma-70 factor (ECF subfamily)